MALDKESLEGLDRTKCGILIGTAMGGMQTFATAVEDLTLKVFILVLPVRMRLVPTRLLKHREPPASAAAVQRKIGPSWWQAVSWQLSSVLHRGSCEIAVIWSLCLLSAAQCEKSVQGHRRMNPFCIPFAITNMSGALLAMDLGFMGPNYSISTACATGNYCILR